MEETSVSQNPGTDPQIPLNIFAGLVSFMDPIALPMGASPDCSDCVFQPGGVAARPCLKKVFAAAFGAVTVTYGKSFIDPKGIIRNIYLDSAGNLWIENVTSNPGVYALLATTTPGSYAKSITAFGGAHEYIAISDGLHGSDIPLQLSYDSAGNAQLDRVTQDGPGASPDIANLILPPTNVAAAAAPLTIALTEIDPQNPDPSSGFFTSLNIFTAAALTGFAIGQSIVIGGTGTVFDGACGPITGLFLGGSNLIQVSAYIPAGTPFYLGAGTVSVQQGALQRQSNIVTATTTTPHQLQPGFRQQITNALALEVGTGVSSIVIDNVNHPGGIATVTVGLAAGQINHGLTPGVKVNIVGVVAAAVGTAIISITRTGQIVTVVMSGATGLSPGGIVKISAVPTASFNTITQVINVTTTTVANDTFTYSQIDVDAQDLSGTGTIALAWPIANTPTPQLFEVVAAPSPTTFQIAIDYSDGTWTTGTVSHAWNGTFFVLTVPDDVTFTYQQYGPDGTASPVSGSIVTTPVGQVAPGQHQMQVFFITRSGYTTAPSPPVKFVANGGQYLSLTNIPIGPSNVVARAIAFTGAEGAYFFYIPAPPQVNGQIVGTATQINDNTTEAIVLDFGDPTLFRATGISTQGNNLANQIVLDGALGFAFYGSRLFTYGQRNVIDNLLNLGFDGGYLPNANTLPTGWDASANAGGSLATGHYGSGWQIIVVGGGGNKGKLSQSLYEDYGGAPIARASTQYTARVWLKPTVAAADLTFTISITSASAVFSATATIAGNLMNTAGSWLEAVFSQKMPAIIPSDLVVNVYASSAATNLTLLVDEINLIYTDSPYLNGLIGSYFNNPEGFDGVTGPIGPVNDTHQVLDVGIIRDNLYMLTRDPAGRLHETSQGITEPAEWAVNEVGANCGTVSAFAMTRSQSDDGSAAGGEEWFAWYSATGYRIFGGEAPEKISQEIQRPAGQVFPGAPADLGDINEQSLLRVWSLNDPDQKVIYLGVPLSSTGSNKAPNRVFMMSYLGLESAAAIVANPPIHKALSGKLVATDMGRKWSPWTLPMNGAALMYRTPGVLQPVFFNGDGLAPNTGALFLFGNVYTLDSTLYTDDDYGQMFPYYVTYGFPDRDTAQQLQLSGLNQLTYQQAFFTGVGFMNWSVLYNSLANVWPLNGVYLMSAIPLRNIEWAGGQCTAQRFFFKFAPSPNAAGTTAHPATDNAFSLSVLVVGMKSNARMKAAGSSR